MLVNIYDEFKKIHFPQCHSHNLILYINKHSNSNNCRSKKFPVLTFNKFRLKQTDSKPYFFMNFKNNIWFALNQQNKCVIVKIKDHHNLCRIFSKVCFFVLCSRRNCSVVFALLFCQVFGLKIIVFCLFLWFYFEII